MSCAGNVWNSYKIKIVIDVWNGRWTNCLSLNLNERKFSRESPGHRFPRLSQVTHANACDDVRFLEARANISLQVGAFDWRVIDDDPHLHMARRGVCRNCAATSSIAEMYSRPLISHERGRWWPLNSPLVRLRVAAQWMETSLHSSDRCYNPERCFSTSVSRSRICKCLAIYTELYEEWYHDITAISLYSNSVNVLALEERQSANPAIDSQTRKEHIGAIQSVVRNFRARVLIDRAWLKLFMR